MYQWRTVWWCRRQLTSPHSETPVVSLMWTLNVLPVPSRLLSFTSFLPQSRDVHIRFIAFSVMCESVSIWWPWMLLFFFLTLGELKEIFFLYIVRLSLCLSWSRERYFCCTRRVFIFILCSLLWVFHEKSLSQMEVTWETLLHFFCWSFA